MVNKLKLTLIFCVVSVLLYGCTNNERIPESIKWSVSKYSDITGKDYEETTEGYKAAFYTIDEISIDKIKDWIHSCNLNGKYHQYIYSDPDSWDMYLYYPTESKMNYNKLKFYINDSCVNIYVESGDKLENTQKYVLIRVQAPHRGAWPSSSKLFVDNYVIDLQNDS